MHLQWLAVTAFATSAIATPYFAPRLAPRQNSTSPCAVVSASAAAALAASPKATPTISAQLGFDCLNSVSLHAPQALALVDSIVPFVQWQTDLAYLKDPPSGYQEPAVDVIASFNEVLTNISTSTYTNEYDFQAHLFAVFNSVHDGHFRFLPDLLSKAITFRRPVGLVSVSLDGFSEPKVYAYNDVIVSLNSSFTPSALTSIDGEDVYTFLEAEAQGNFLQDPDAAYNILFYSPAFEAAAPGWKGFFAGSGRQGYVYPGATTTFAFENGTTFVYENTASVKGDFSGVTDGNSFYQVFCTGPPDSTPTSASTTTAVSTATPTATASGPVVPAGYPTPVVITPDQSAAGYYIPDLPDVAVLSLLSFDPDVPVDFQMAVQEFFADALAAGKTKLVIDLSANGGGLILQGYDTFRQLFPQIIQDGFTRFRNQEGFDLIAEEYAAIIPANYSPATASADLINIFESAPNYRFDYNITDQPFTSLQAKLGPQTYHGDNFTNIIRWDLDDPILTINATFGMGEEITGYGNRSNFTQPFAAENIIMMYDGYCASTCTLFSEFMRVQAGIKSVVFGGRPTLGLNASAAIIQAIGGTKGANNYAYGDITYYAESAYDAGTPAQQAQANWTKYLAPLLNTLAVNRSTDTSINVRDNILRYELASGTPAQFIYEPADCRLFYTPEMITGPTAIWTATANAAWGSQKCVAGGLPGSAPSNGSVAQKWRRKSRRSEVEKRAMRVISTGAEPVVKSNKFMALFGQQVPK